MIKTFALILTMAISWPMPQQQLWEFPVDEARIAIDDLENVYLLKKDKIIKVLPGGTQQYVFSDLRMIGDYQFDVSRSLRPALFYPELGRLTVLDNTLSAHIPEIDLYNLPYGRITAMGVSRIAPHYWIFDQSTFELIRLDQGLKQILSSGNLATVLGKDVYPSKIVEHDEKVFLFDISGDVLVFDVFGTYYFTLHLLDLKDSHVSGNFVYGHDGSSIKVYNLKSKVWKKVPLPVQDPESVRVLRDKIYLIDRGKLRVYPLMTE